MPLDLSAFDAVLKNNYEKTVIELLNPKIRALKLFGRETGTWVGRRVEYPLNVSRNQGTMATAENGALPTAGAQGYASHQIPIRYQHGRIQLSIQVIKASQSSKGAFKRAMDQEMKGLVRDLSTDRNRQMFGWGKGILALVNGDPGTGTTLTVDSPGGVAGAVNGCRFLQVGMNIAFINPATGAIRAGGARTITALPTNLTATIAAADAAVEDNDWVVRAAGPTSTVVGDTAYDKEPMGLLGLVDDSTYLTTLHNISRTTYPIFGSHVIASVGALSADILQRGIDIAEQRGQGSVDYMLCHHSVRRAYLALMEGDRRYIGVNIMKPNAGTVAAKLGELTFGEIPMIVDKDAPYGMLFGVDSSSFMRWIECEGEWADDDGTILLRIAGVDAYEGRYRIFDNYSVDEPASCFRLDGITANVVAIHID